MTEKIKDVEQIDETNQEMSLSIIEKMNPLCSVFVKSGIFEDVKDVSQAMVKILYGREMGLTPLESMMGLYIVKKGIAAESKVISSLIKKSKKYDYKIEVLTETECTIIFYEFDIETHAKEAMLELGKSTFTIKDAAKAGIVNKDNWKNYPRNMLFARAMANGARWYCPDVFCGYTPDELDEIETIPKITTVTLNTETGEVKNGKE